MQHMLSKWRLPRYTSILIALGAMLTAGTARPVAAQDSTDWRYGTTLAVFGGAASPDAGTSAVAGTAVGWEVTPHFTVEGRGIWFGGGRSDVFTALLGARVPLLPARGVVPFVSGGMGLHRATLDMNGETPAFYRRGDSDGATFARRTFDDFAMTVGGGVDMFLARHLALRPELTVVVVTTRSAARVVPVYGIHLAYHFESHPITPSRSR